jgi:FixJ family two-component response regulator
MTLTRDSLMKIPVISIVDDDDSFRKAATSFIRSLGYVATAFASAEDFLQAGPIEETDCLITDVQMPGMTGFELQSQLLARGHRLPIIFISAFPEMKARGHALAAGAIGFLDKPFNDEKLITCLNEALATRSA